MALCTVIAWDDVHDMQESYLIPAIPPPSHTHTHTHFLCLYVIMCHMCQVSVIQAMHDPGHTCRIMYS